MNKHSTVNTALLDEMRSRGARLLTRTATVATLHWLFSSNRTPAPDCDTYNRYPESDHLIAMKRGHAYQVPLRDGNGQVIAYDKLKSIFETISKQAPNDINWVGILTADHRDKWANVRRWDVLGARQAN